MGIKTEMLVRVKMCAIYSYINNIIQTDCGEVVGAWMQQAKFKVKNRLLEKHTLD